MLGQSLSVLQPALGETPLLPGPTQRPEKYTGKTVTLALRANADEAKPTKGCDVRTTLTTAALACADSITLADVTETDTEANGPPDITTRTEMGPDAKGNDADT